VQRVASPPIQTACDEELDFTGFKAAADNQTQRHGSLLPDDFCNSRAAASLMQRDV
jgi:hypothetical protein